MPKRSKVLTIAKLKAKLDLVFKAYIRARDLRDDGTFVCVSCGMVKTKDQMHAGHFYASTFTATRWDESNVNSQCIACNVFLHGNLLNYRNGMLDKYGYGEINRLELLHNKPVKLERQWLEERIEHYKNLIK